MSAAEALQLISTIRSLPPPTSGHRDGRARTYGVQLAKHGVDVFHDVLASLGDEPDLLDLFACWMQELVMEGAEVGGPSVDQLVEKLIAAKHPLAHLPLYLLPIEHAPPEKLMAMTWQDMRVHLDMHAAREITPPEDLGALYEAHVNVSNGTVETRAFVLDPPMLRAADPELLQSLKLECITGSLSLTRESAQREALGPPRTRSLSVAAVAFTQVFATMTHEARFGGAYESSWSRAYGRSYVWRSLAAFADLPRDASLHDIARICEQMSWTLFLADSNWFAHVSWDYGLAGISPDGTRLFVFAGTDTD